MSKLNKEDMGKILAAIEAAYAEAGRKLTTATLITDAGEELLIDNRNKDEMH